MTLLAAAARKSIVDKAVSKPGIGWTVYGSNQTDKQVSAAKLPGSAAVCVQISPGPSRWWRSGRRSCVT